MKLPHPQLTASRESSRTKSLQASLAPWIWVLVLAIGLGAGPRPAATTPAVSSQEEMLARILERAREFEKAYVGAYSRREIVTKILDGDSGELKRTRASVVDVWEYHGEFPTNEVRECTMDDEPIDLEKCLDPQRIEPAYRLFAQDAEEHYRFRYEALGSWKGRRSHKIEIIPLDDTTRHLRGNIFFAVDTLQVLGMDISIADFPFGLKKLAIELNFENREGQTVIASGSSSATIYSPFLVNERAVTAFTASQQRLLTERRTEGAIASGL